MVGENARGRQRTMWLAALNVTSEPPFNPQRYADLFNLIINKVPAPLGAFGQERLTLYRFSQVGNTIEGAFGRYTYIDPNSPWWDSEERKALVDSQGKPLPQVREGIGPNFKEISFIFYLDKHILVFDLTPISANQFSKGVQGIFSDWTIQQEFGVINVTLFPAQNALEQVLSLPSIRHIKFLLTIPNPDVSSSLEQEFVERMNAMGAGKTEQKFTSQQGEDIEPDDELKAILSLASRNGYVESTGRDENGKSDTRSTRQYPWKERATYYASEAKANVLRRWGQWFADKLRPPR